MREGYDETGANGSGLTEMPMSPWCLMPVRTIDEVEFLPTLGGGSWAEEEV